MVVFVAVGVVVVVGFVVVVVVAVVVVVVVVFVVVAIVVNAFVLPHRYESTHVKSVYVRKNAVHPREASLRGWRKLLPRRNIYAGDRILSRRST